MIAPDFSFRGFDAQTWSRWFSLFARQGERRRSGTLLVVAIEQRPLVAFHSERGRLPLPSQLESLPELCRAHDSRRCVVLQPGAVDALLSRAREEILATRDYGKQLMALAGAFRSLQLSGDIRVWPTIPPLPLPTAPAAQLGYDWLLPDDHAAVAVVFEGAEFWTAIALRKRDGAIDRVVGPELLKAWVGALGGDWRRDHRAITAATERHLGRVHLGLFMQRDTARRLCAERQRGSWATAFATRELIAQPWPPALGLAVGADGLAGAMRLGLQWLGGVEPSETWDYLQGVARGFVEGGDDLGLPVEEIAGWLGRLLGIEPPDKQE